MGIKQKLDRVHLETLGRDDDEVLCESFRDTRVACGADKSPGLDGINFFS